MATATTVTEKSAKSLQWRDEEYIAWDTDLEGFGVRVWGPGNKRGYIIQTKHHGRSHRKALGKVGQVTAQGARDHAIACQLPPGPPQTKLQTCDSSPASTSTLPLASTRSLSA